jgi:hypothetical protein
MKTLLHFLISVQLTACVANTDDSRTSQMWNDKFLQVLYINFVCETTNFFFVPGFLLAKAKLSFIPTVFVP